MISHSLNTGSYLANLPLILIICSDITIICTDTMIICTDTTIIFTDTKIICTDTKIMAFSKQILTQAAGCPPQGFNFPAEFLFVLCRRR